MMLPPAILRLLPHAACHIHNGQVAARGTKNKQYEKCFKAVCALICLPPITSASA